MAAPVNVIIRGMALNSEGFTAEDSISGLGLNTFGFLWDASSIWTEVLVGVTTAWVACTGPGDPCD